ncbi:unnamed protein product [Spirodela intermedia]|uniref:BAG domain-containing protein n=1 Tax=Spirodela intermedia TaxID=51605 RepID=A0A7I8I7C8_SPIIN|nr:unnamed protein product [Spirodela intermedia]CAA6653466.1 unnamed protein product [Spirodela intermedia]
MEDHFRPSFWSGNAGPAKVVSIPVHFIGSDEKEKRQKTPPAAAAAAAADGRPRAGITMLAAAMRIQKACRGFLVRKNMKVLRQLEVEVEIVEKEVKGSEDRLGADAKERIRVSEALMSLLFRLDSVRGVRDYRRRVIRRAIAIQEAVDAIATADTKGEEEEVVASGKNISDESGAAPVPTEEIRASVSAVDDGAPLSSCELVDSEGLSEVKDTTAADTMEEIQDEVLASGEESQDRHGDLSEDAIESEEVRGERSVAARMLPRLPTPAGVAQQSTGDGEEARRCMTQFMERMAEENRGLKGLVAELCEKNEIQFHLMSGLLERMERQKKRRAADSKKARARKCERRW